MQKVSIQITNSKIILALGAESAGNFSVYKNGIIYHSKNFGDLLNENNFASFKKAILTFLRKEKIKPKIILTDLHPEMKTTLWGQELAKKFKADHIQIQHHCAHIFSQLQKDYFELGDAYGIALDGTGYGTDEKIWGGEVFKITKSKKQKIKDKNRKPRGIDYKLIRIGHLENQLMIGGDLAIREPARMLVSILSKIGFNSTSPNSPLLTAIIQNIELLDKDAFGKNLAYHFIKSYYSKNQFELLYNQLQQNFNCQKTSSTGRVLDAIAVLLGFAKNERKCKHHASNLLKKNSTKPYLDLKPKITKITDGGHSSRRREFSAENFSTEEVRPREVIFRKNKNLNINSKFLLNTTHLFKYLIKNIHRDKHRLAATAQLYIAQGFDEIIKKYHQQNIKQKTKNCNQNNSLVSIHPYFVILSGGISDNEIISKYFENQCILQNKKSNIARGDAGLSYGQILFYFSKYPPLY